jgi:hypothetical protein
MMSIVPTCPNSTSIIVALLLVVSACGGPNSESLSYRSVSARNELSEPEAKFPAAFSSIVGMRELSDGTVFVSDRLGQALMIVDMVSGTADTIGRVGGGPGEYSVPGQLFPWHGDSTLLVDMGNTRFTPVGSDGGFGISVPLMTRDGEAMSLVIPEATDRHGNVYYQARSVNVGAPRTNDTPDSVSIVRWNPETGRTDTVAALRQPERRIERSGGNVMMIPLPFAPSDDWAVSWDGDVGVARGVGFRIEWATNAGQHLAGPDIAYVPVAITHDDRDAWIEARANPPGGGMFITIEAGGSGGNVRAAPMPRGARMAGPQVSEEDWPEVKPPFPPSAVAATPEGELWVQRHVTYGARSEYDVFDAKGERIRTVVLPDDGRLVGFGDGVVYVARTDDDDLQWLERYGR